MNSTEGLLRVLRRLQEIEGFGLLDHDRSGSYSLLLVDVSIYWRLFRLLYSYSGLAPLRHDLFLGFGFWHAYSYAHVALWSEFRLTFLGPAFFVLFPGQTLLDRPKLIQSTTFLMWLRLAYPQFKTDLLKALQRLKTILAADDIAGVEYNTPNTNRARYVHMPSIFEFCIPAIQDYLVVLKSNNWEEFRCCFRRCRFLLSCLYLHAISHRIHNIIFFCHPIL